MGAVFSMWLVNVYADNLLAMNYLELLLLAMITTLAISVGFVSNTFTSLLGFLLFGWQFGLVMWVIYALVLLIGYEIAKYWQPVAAVERLASKRASVQKFVQDFPKKGFWLLFWGRLVPVLPFMSTNLLYQGLGVSRTSFLGSGMLALQPRLLLIFGVCSSIKGLKVLEYARSQTAPYLLALGLTALLGVAYQVWKLQRYD
ncbi:MAG: hypothetical protein EAZ57_07150 [Cytophagales bacterium]|nr:MAG: hypothetical protein EAZ67_07960 [Cytophagales bacterium]TAF60478.1 MAG: hypothetical protein EAZ57_07150 [Cytophagales bacterium]